MNNLGNTILINVGVQAYYNLTVKMANLALNVNVRWNVLIALLIIFSVAFFLYYSSPWKAWPKSAAKKQAEESAVGKYFTWNTKDRTKDQIYYKEVLPQVSENTRFTVILLHGQLFTSENWDNIGTLKALAAKSYKAIAVDLPGHGHSESVKAPSDEDEKVNFVSSLIENLGVDRAVLVAPSMSGSYVLPALMEKDLRIKIRGFIPVAPGAVAKYEENDLRKLNLPTLIVYGELDKNFKPFFPLIKNIPNSEVFMMKNAKHACYLDNPEEFNARIIEFLDKL